MTLGVAHQDIFDNGKNNFLGQGKRPIGCINDSANEPQNKFSTDFAKSKTVFC